MGYQVYLNETVQYQVKVKDFLRMSLHVLPFYVSIFRYNMKTLGCCQTGLIRMDMHHANTPHMTIACTRYYLWTAATLPTLGIAVVYILYQLLYPTQETAM